MGVNKTHKITTNQQPQSSGGGGFLGESGLWRAVGAPRVGRDPAELSGEAFECWSENSGGKGRGQQGADERRSFLVPRGGLSGGWGFFIWKLDS